MFVITLEVSRELCDWNVSPVKCFWGLAQINKSVLKLLAQHIYDNLIVSFRIKSVTVRTDLEALLLHNVQIICNLICSTVNMNQLVLKKENIPQKTSSQSLKSSRNLFSV